MFSNHWGHFHKIVGFLGGFLNQKKLGHFKIFGNVKTFQEMF